MQDSELIAILWHQEESDSCNGNFKTYYNKLHAMIEALRTKLNIETIPLIIGGLGDYLGKSGFDLTCTEYESVNKELLRYANEHKYVYFATAKELTANPAGIHLDAIHLIMCPVDL
ncbi:MAG: sialate O-acetylesterase [Dorea sp.]|nr:sialate O-acetylesterase [Dorea sp.]